MNNNTRIVILVLGISFFSGLWWGLYRTQKSWQSLEDQRTVKILNYNNSLPNNLASNLKSILNINIQITNSYDSDDFIFQINNGKFDLFFYKSYIINHVSESSALEQINLSSIKYLDKIERDFWPSKKYDWKKIIPFSWGVYGFASTQPHEDIKILPRWYNLDFEVLYLTLSSEFPTLEKEIENLNSDLTISNFNEMAKKINLYDHLSEKHFNDSVFLSRAEFEGYSRKVNNLKFEYPTFGAFLWFNVVSVSKRGMVHTPSKKLLNALISNNIQSQLLKENSLASVFAHTNGEVYSANYLRQIPLSKIWMPLETKMEMKNWKRFVESYFSETLNKAYRKTANQ